MNEGHVTNLTSSPPTLSSLVCEWISLAHLSLEDHSLSRDTKRAFLTLHNIMLTFRDVITKAEFLLSYFQHLSIGRQVFEPGKYRTTDPAMLYQLGQFQECFRHATGTIQTNASMKLVQAQKSLIRS